MSELLRFSDGSGQFPAFSLGTGTTYKFQHEPVIEGVIMAYEAGFRLNTPWKSLG